MALQDGQETLRKLRNNKNKFIETIEEQEEENQDSIPELSDGCT